MAQRWTAEDLENEHARYTGHELWRIKSCGVVHDTFDAEDVTPDPNAVYWDAVVAAVQSR